MAVVARPQARAEGRSLGTWLVRSGIRRIVLVAGLAIFTVWTLFPFAWIVTTSIKPNREIYSAATLIPQRITGVHYRTVLQQTRFGTYFKNSLIVSSLTTVISMAIGVLAAYAISRLSFRGRTFMARSIIVTYLVPGTLLFIPLFQIAYQLRLTDKTLGLVVVYLVHTVPFCTWLAISYFNTIPGELEDAALVDAGRLHLIAEHL